MKIHGSSGYKMKDTCNEVVLVVGEYGFNMATILTSDMDSKFVFTENVIVSQH